VDRDGGARVNGWQYVISLAIIGATVVGVRWDDAWKSQWEDDDAGA
jgi:hypothetical protein